MKTKFRYRLPLEKVNFFIYIVLSNIFCSLLLFPTVLNYFIVCFYFVLEIEFRPGFLASSLIKNLL